MNVNVVTTKENHQNNYEQKNYNQFNLQFQTDLEIHRVMKKILSAINSVIFLLFLTFYKEIFTTRIYFQKNSKVCCLKSFKIESNEGFRKIIIMVKNVL